MNQNQFILLTKNLVLQSPASVARSQSGLLGRADNTAVATIANPGAPELKADAFERVMWLAGV
jgi:hypothetical protein